MLATGAGTFAATTFGTEPAAAAVDVPWFDVREPWGGGPGAVGDGGADDTGALQRAIDAAANSSNGGVVLPPPGAFKITAPVIFPASTSIDLIGAGKWSSRIVCAAEDAGVWFGEDPLNGAATGSSGGFWIRGVSEGVGNPRATTAMTVERCVTRRFFDIQISHAATGLRVESAQNSIFENMLVVNNTETGIVLDWGGAGNNTFLAHSLRNNGVNVRFQNSWEDGTDPEPTAFRGRPTRNKFITCIIEGGEPDENTAFQVDHASGLLNSFIGCSFAGNGPKLKVRHQKPERDQWGSYQVSLLGCSLVSGNGIEHTAQGCTVHVRATDFRSLVTAYTLGDGCRVDLDTYDSSGVDHRFANAPGGTATEAELIRHSWHHPLEMMTPSEDDTSLVTYTGTYYGDRSDHPLHHVSTSGLTEWGSGAAAPDVKLGRADEGQLEVERTDGSTDQPTLLIKGGLGVGNSDSATNIPNPETVAHRIEVFDADGNSLGYIPVYPSIT